jgi:hypothetical protein
MPLTTIVSANDREPDDDVGHDADRSGMTAMSSFDLFVKAATKFVARHGLTVNCQKQANKVQEIQCKVYNTARLHDNQRIRLDV